MDRQQTLSIIKPDAMKSKLSGKIINFIEEKSLRTFSRFLLKHCKSKKIKTDIRKAKTLIELFKLI